MMTKSGMILGLAALACCAAEAAPLTGRPAVECQVRGGLPNFYRQAEQGGRTLRVGYFGGSITAAWGWRVLSLDWLKSRFPKTQFQQIDGAISGTNSTLGAYRLQQDMLSKKPDLLFVEFAVNDGWSEEPTLRAMEGIVRQAWRSNPEMDICFVYTISQGMIPHFKEGKLPPSASRMEDVADRYAIPSVAFGVDVTRRLQAGTLVFTSKLDQAARAAEQEKGICHFSGDGVHPFGETGHRLYTATLSRSLEIMWTRVPPAFVKHELGQPMRKDNLEFASMVPLAKAQRSGPWHQQDSQAEKPACTLRNRMPVLWEAEGPGATLDFSFKGTECFIYDLEGPDCGVVAVSLDGQPPVKSERICKDVWSHCYILRLLPVGSKLEDKVHTVHIEVLPEKIPDKLKYLNNSLDAKFKALTAETLAASDYDHQRWYAACILLLGELVP